MEYKGVSNDKAIIISLDIIREPYEWPGGYEKVAFTDDGGVLCNHCVKENLHLIANSYKGDGWHVVGSDIVENYGGIIECDHCGRVIFETED